MAPIVERKQASLRDWIDNHVRDNVVTIFSKSTCPFCKKIKNFFTDKNVPFKALELDEMGQDGNEVQALLHEQTGQRTVPNVFVRGKHLGGCDDTLNAAKSAEFLMTLTVNDGGSKSTLPESGEGSDAPIKANDDKFDYDLIVVGGGSGGLAASKEAAKLGLKTAVFDFVTPTPIGTTWGLGGTCVNVGCIPKKLMHQASLLGDSLAESKLFGWEAVNSPDIGDRKPMHSWTTMVGNIQDYIKSLNWGYKSQLRGQNVKYCNELVKFVDLNRIEATKKNGQAREVTATNFILATGGRPRYPDIPGAKQLGITSDDIFSLPYHPGKTLLVGASYIALETAGFLHGIGIDTTVMVRSILLRGFDQQVSEKIGTYMEGLGMKFLRPCVPTSLVEVEKGQPGKILVKAQHGDGTEFEDVYNTVIFAIGRYAETTNLGIKELGIKLNPKNDKLIVNDAEQTNVQNIFAVGDIVDGRPELTPVAIQAGKLLARRLASISTLKTDYTSIATTVFTPVEYGCVGLAEEAAMEKYGEDDLEVFHTNFWPLEWTVAKRPENTCYAKLICVKSQSYRVVGLHYMGPNAGEVTQGYSGMLKLGATKEDFDNLIGIHPTTAEVFTTMNITKSSGTDPTSTGC